MVDITAMPYTWFLLYRIYSSNSSKVKVLPNNISTGVYLGFSSFVSFCYIIEVTCKYFKYGNIRILSDGTKLECFVPANYVREINSCYNTNPICLCHSTSQYAC